MLRRYGLRFAYEKKKCSGSIDTLHVIGWAAHLYGVNQALDSHALRYRILRMELGYTQPNIASLDSLFSSEDSDDSIRKLRSRVTNYELAIERQAELHLQQQRLSQEQEALTQQLQQ